jgi:hypothetical protein
VPPPFLSLLQPTLGAPAWASCAEIFSTSNRFVFHLLVFLTCIVLGGELRGDEKRKREGEKEKFFVSFR